MIERYRISRDMACREATDSVYPFRVIDDVSGACIARFFQEAGAREYVGLANTGCFSDAALGRQVREAAAAMGVEPGVLVDALPDLLNDYTTIHLATGEAAKDNKLPSGEMYRLILRVRNRTGAILARLSPAPERDAAGGEGRGAC